MADKQEHLRTLKQFYKIKGDGVAELRLEEAVKDQRFIDTLKAMSRVKVNDRKTEEVESQPV